MERQHRIPTVYFAIASLQLLLGACSSGRLSSPPPFIPYSDAAKKVVDNIQANPHSPAPPFVQSAFQSPFYRSQQLNPQQIQMIRDTAGSICNTVKGAKGHKSNVEMQVNGQLKKLLGKVGDIGGSGTGKISREEFEGLSREATSTALEGDRNCRERLFDKMFEQLNAAPATLTVKNQTDCTLGFYLFGPSPGHFGISPRDSGSVSIAAGRYEFGIDPRFCLGKIRLSRLYGEEEFRAGRAYTFSLARPDVEKAGKYIVNNNTGDILTVEVGGNLYEVDNNPETIELPEGKNSITITAVCGSQIRRKSLDIEVKEGSWQQWTYSCTTHYVTESSDKNL